MKPFKTSHYLSRILSEHLQNLDEMRKRPGHVSDDVRPGATSH